MIPDIIVILKMVTAITFFFPARILSYSPV